MVNLSLSKEEWANLCTHALGIPFCLMGSILLLSKAGQQITAVVYAGLWIYCFSLLFVFVTSTVYHSQTEPQKKHFFRIIDHIAIYFLIAGTHTPFTLLYLPTTYGFCFLSILWILVIFGIGYKIFFVGRYEAFSIVLYMAMGWSAILTIPFMWQQIPENVFGWILGGGLSYTIGGVFYAWRGLPYHHAIWHLFVIGGSFGHFVAIWLCI